MGRTGGILFFFFFFLGNWYECGSEDKDLIYFRTCIFRPPPPKKKQPKSLGQTDVRCPDSEGRSWNSYALYHQRASDIILPAWPDYIYNVPSSLILVSKSRLKKCLTYQQAVGPLQANCPFGQTWQIGEIGPITNNKVK